MLLNRSGLKVTKKPEEVIEVSGELKVEYVVRMISDNGFRKEVIAEEVFKDSPTDNQILYCLAKHKTASFAVVDERYMIDENCGLPFC